MARDLAARLLIEGVPPETKKALQETARRLYGQPNASLMVRSLIAAHLAKGDPATAPLTAMQAGDTVRVELRLPRVVLEKAAELAEGRVSARNYYLAGIILAHFGNPQLQGDEIEVLRRSNYELSKVGTNLNQVAKAFNTLVMNGSGGKLPEVGKKIASLRREVTEHTGRVLRVLNAGTAVWENTGRGSVRKGKGKGRK
jgi:hypothetical protein